MEGWISIHRKIQGHWLYKEKRKLSKFEAWLYLLMNANHSKQKVLISNDLFLCERGELLRSQKTLSSDWGWNKTAVNRFLKLLEKDDMILVKSETVTTRITICKYDTYQQNRNDDETQVKRKRNDPETIHGTNNKGNNGDNENNEKNIPQSPKVDPYTFDQFWDDYGNKKARGKVEPKWNKYSDEDKKLIKESIPIYNQHLKANPWKQKADPLTWLNGKRWLDEYEPQEKPQIRPDLQRQRELDGGVKFG